MSDFAVAWVCITTMVVAWIAADTIVKVLA